jgi:hypothetical protein
VSFLILWHCSRLCSSNLPVEAVFIDGLGAVAAPVGLFDLLELAEPFGLVELVGLAELAESSYLRIMA